MVLYDGQGRVVYDTGDVYHVVQVSEVVAVIQFDGQCPHGNIIALYTAAFHPTANARGLSRRLICNPKKHCKVHLILQVHQCSLLCFHLPFL